MQAEQALGDTILGKVVGITDGDTVTVLGATWWQMIKAYSRQRWKPLLGCLQGLVPEVEQTKIAMRQEDELTLLHFGLGQWVRNHLGLWGDNPTLLAATGETNADDASGAIIRAFWQTLREDLPKVH